MTTLIAAFLLSGPILAEESNIFQIGRWLVAVMRRVRRINSDLYGDGWLLLLDVDAAAAGSLLNLAVFLQRLEKEAK